jgi:membrane protease YdiL (CAAX protease family)
MRNFIKKYPIPIYFIIAFAISWGGILIVSGIDGFLGTTQVNEELMPLIYLATLLGPSLAGIISTGIVNGKEGFRKLYSRLLSWQIDFKWYLIALLIAPVLLIVILFALMSISSSYLPGIFGTDDKASLIISGIAAGIMVGIFEELGWTGFAVPQMSQRFGVLKTGLITGLLWGLWHMPLFMGSVRSTEEIPPVIYLAVLLFSFLPAFRVLMVWIYNQTGSLLIIMLMHASLTASILILPPLEVTAKQVITYDLIFAISLWLIVAIIAIGKKGNLSK